MILTDIDYALLSLVAVMVLFNVANWAKRREAPSVNIHQPPTLVDVSEPMKARIDGMAAQLKDHEAKLGDIDHDVRGLRTGIMALPSRDQVPSKDTVHQLQVEIAEMRGEIRVVDERSEGIGHAVLRIENHLLTNAKGSS